MRGLNRATPIVTLAAALACVTCTFPTDKSDQVFVTLQAPAHIVLRGKEMSIQARAWQVVGVDTMPITNVDFAFSSGSNTIARVENIGKGSATVTGVNSGNVDIIARALSFEKARQADLSLRVSSPLEIDSVRPKLVRYGQVATVYGVGVDSLFLASLGGTNLIEYPFSRVRDPVTGLGRISYWVPPPAHNDSLFYLGAGVFGKDTALTQVAKRDIYEPNDTFPTRIDLDLGGPWPGTVLAPILFWNPALAFEAVDRVNGVGEDWFRFETADTAQSLTVFISYASLGDTVAGRTFLLDSLRYATGVAGQPVNKFFGRDSADFIGTDFYRCKGLPFKPAQSARDSFTVALKTLPSHALHVINFFTRFQRYSLAVARGYVTGDPRIRPDAFEPNRFCHYADSIPGQPSPPARIHVTTTGFSDTMNIDNAFALDWYRLEVPAHNLGDSVLVRLQGRPFVTGSDSSDLDLYVLSVPGSTGNLTVVDSSVSPGSTENLMMNLAAGSYYLAVVDFAGVPMRYSLCIREIPLLTVAGTCTLILPGPPLAARVKRVARRPPSPTGDIIGGGGFFVGPRRNQ